MLKNGEGSQNYSSLIFVQIKIETCFFSNGARFR